MIAKVNSIKSITINSILFENSKNSFKFLEDILQNDQSDRQTMQCIVIGKDLLVFEILIYVISFWMIFDKSVHSAGVGMPPTPPTVASLFFHTKLYELIVSFG
jgi:hypothetical protein